MQNMAKSQSQQSFDMPNLQSIDNSKIGAEAVKQPLNTSYSQRQHANIGNFKQKLEEKSAANQQWSKQSQATQPFSKEMSEWNKESAIV